MVEGASKLLGERHYGHGHGYEKPHALEHLPNHDHHGHDHHSHDHHGHDHHDHDHHDHDHHDHDHHDHLHSHKSHQHYDNGYSHQHHDHSSHGHSHKSHGHSHDHSHAHQHYHYNYPPVAIPPFPSWSSIFATLTPMQKTIFTWFLIHLSIGALVWWAGASRDSLALAGFSYLVFFDAFGVLNTFVSDVVRTNPAFQASNTKRPFTACRYDIVFAMANTIFLLYVTMYTLKESLEHSLTEHEPVTSHHNDHHNDQRALGFTGFIIMCLAMGATFISCVSLKNHDNFVRYLRRSPPTVHGFSYNVINGARGNAVNIILCNVYSSSIVATGLALIFFFISGFMSSSMDKFLSFGESVVMIYLGAPTALALMKLVLQTTPDVARSGIENRLMEIRQNKDVIAVDRVHFWQNTYGKCVGTLEIQVRAEADEESVLQFVYQKLEGLTSTDPKMDGSGYPRSELTVSIIKQ
ncbi:cation efflux family-domain-containing protein [Dichotomocladium elegans]|nr:cation efflux family-domain-containing protein [Dichotomocladium elegans]